MAVISPARRWVALVSEKKANSEIKAKRTLLKDKIIQRARGNF
jgi:hypothetical protein